MPRSRTKAEIPLCFAAGSVFAKTSAWSATFAYEIQFFEPLRTYTSPSRRAVDFIAATSEPAAGLGQPEARELLAARLRHEPALLLLLGPVLQQRERVEAHVDRDQRPECSLAALDLLAGERLGDEVEPGAAVFLGDHDPEDAELGHPLDRPEVEVVVDVVLDGVREGPLVHEPSNRVLKESLLVAELEVHAA